VFFLNHVAVSSAKNSVGRSERSSDNRNGYLSSLRRSQPLEATSDTGHFVGKVKARTIQQAILLKGQNLMSLVLTSAITSQARLFASIACTTARSSRSPLRRQNRFPTAWNTREEDTIQAANRMVFKADTSELRNDFTEGTVQG
jgi:hypothetical protein